MDTFFQSVTLDPDLCKGCINCLKRCPTEAIRVRNSKASIINEFCIDCGECVRICPHHAKKVKFDSFRDINKFEYKIALPPPSLYAQFNNLDDKSLVLKALLSLGFDDVFEVGTAAEMVSEMTRTLLKEKSLPLPIISAACPAVVRLIRVKFPNLIDHISPIIAPVDLAAELAVRKAMRTKNLKREQIGVVFITPCPAKYTAINSPIRFKKSEVDLAVAMSDIYPRLVSHMKKVYESNDEIHMDVIEAGRIGVSWGREGGEASGLLIDNFLAADGIENVNRVLEDLEDSKLDNIDFIELNCCSGGCVGGVLAVENPFFAKVKLNNLRKYLPISGAHMNGNIPDYAFQDTEIEFKPVFMLGETVEESISRMNEVNRLMEILPGLDCGCCGAPTCRTHAEDIARGEAAEKDCIHILREYIHEFTDKFGK